MLYAEVLAGATGDATAFEFPLWDATTAQEFTTATEANTVIAYRREGVSGWTDLDDADAANIFENRGGGMYRQRAIAAPFAAATGVGYVDFRFTVSGALTQIVRVLLRPYDWRTAPPSDSSIATASSTQVLADLAGAPGTAARREIAAEHIGLPQRLVGTITGSGTEVVTVEVDKGAGFVSVGTLTLVNGVVREQS